jgi:hypothetical protein
MRTYVLLFSCLCFYPSLSFADNSHFDRVYGLGAAAWYRGDREEALHQWFKYLEMADRMEGRDKPSQVSMVSHFYFKAWEEREAETWNRYLSEPANEPVVVKKRSRPSVPSIVLPVKNSRQINELLERADQERASGRYENARRIYGFAQQLDSSSPLVKAKLEELNRLMEGN